MYYAEVRILKIMASKSNQQLTINQCKNRNRVRVNDSLKQDGHRHSAFEVSPRALSIANLGFQWQWLKRFREAISLSTMSS